MRYPCLKGMYKQFPICDDIKAIPRSTSLLIISIDRFNDWVSSDI